MTFLFLIAGVSVSEELGEAALRFLWFGLSGDLKGLTVNDNKLILEAESIVEIQRTRI